MLPRAILRAQRHSSRVVARPTSAFAPSRAQRIQMTPAVRRYSEAHTAASNVASKEADAEVTKEAEQSKDNSAQFKEQLEKKDREIIDLKDKYLRQVAEYRNLQERTKREIQAAKDFALERFAKDLVGSVDNLDRALVNVPNEKLSPDNQDLVNLHDGLKMTDNILMNTLKKHGLTRFDPTPENEKFNQNVHEALFHAPQPDKEDGTCFHTQQKGFMLNGRVIRAAKVGVVKNS